MKQTDDGRGPGSALPPCGPRGRACGRTRRPRSPASRPAGHAPFRSRIKRRDRPVHGPALARQALADVLARIRCRGSPSPSRKAARSARPARPAAGPAGSCWRSSPRPAGRRTCRGCGAARGEMSITSGTAVCMRKAISYWAMRVRVSGLPSSWACISLRSRRASRLSRRMVGVHAARIGHVQHRIALRAALHALVDRRQKAAAPVARCRRWGSVPLDTRTMKPGRFWFSEPRP